MEQHPLRVHTRGYTLNDELQDAIATELSTEPEPRVFATVPFTPHHHFSLASPELVGLFHQSLYG